MTLDLNAIKARVDTLQYRLNRPHSDFVAEEGAKALLADSLALLREIERLTAEREKYAPLVAAWRAWQEARKVLHTENDDSDDGDEALARLNAAFNRYTQAELALANWKETE